MTGPMTHLCKKVTCLRMSTEQQVFTTTTKPIPKKKKQIQKQVLELKSMTKGDKKNKNIKIYKECKIHNYWSNIFQRKFEMHEYFSEAAFGSQTDTKIEFRNLWEDPEYIKKYSILESEDNKESIK